MGRRVILNCQGVSIKRAGGVGRYSSELASELPAWAISRGLEFDIEGINPAFDRQPFLRRVKKVVKHAFPESSHQFFKRVLPTHINPAERPNLMRSKASEESESLLLHEVSNYKYSGRVGRLLGSPGFRYVVTFLDIQDFFYPEFFGDEELSARRILYDFLAARGTSFIAISEFTKRTMTERLGIPADLIEVIHLGADVRSCPESDSSVHRRGQLGDYYIYPAKPWSHKNHVFLYRSMARQQSLWRARGHRLVLTGGFTDLERRQATDRLKELGIEDLVEILGFLPDGDLQALVRGARALVFPSLFEGFGMPVVEAQLLGCPVISSSAGSLREVCGDSATLFDPGEDAEIDSVIEASFAADFDRQKWQRKGFENVKRFTWEKCRSATFAHYQRVMEGI